MVFRYEGIITPTNEFYEEFYSELRNKNQEAFKRVMDNYPIENKGKISLSLIKGINIIKKVKAICGPTHFGENPCWTIRGKFGPYNLPNTICHASGNKEEAKHNLEVLKKFGLI